MPPVTAPPPTRIWSADFLRVCLANFGNFGSFYLLLAVLPLYVLAVGGEESQVGLIMGVFALSALGARPVLGTLIDRQGRKPVMFVSLAGMLLASGLYLFAFNPLLLFVVRLLHGVAFAGVSTAAGAYVSEIIPPNRRAESMGYYGMFQNIALAIGPGIGLAVAPLAGFQAVFVVSAIIAAGGLVMALTLRETQRSPGGPPVPMRLFNRAALRPSLVQLLFAFTYAAQLSFLPVYAVARDLGNAGWYFFLYAVVLVVSRGPAGIVADRLGRGWTIIPGLLLASVSMLTLALATNIVLLLVTAVLFALAMAMVTPAINAMVVDVTAPSERGSALATFTSAMDLGIGAGSLLWGIVAQAFGLSALYQVATVAPLLGLLAYLLVVRNRTRPWTPAPA
jgi:MFS family permease